MGLFTTSSQRKSSTSTSKQGGGVASPPAPRQHIGGAPHLPPLLAQPQARAQAQARPSAARNPMGWGDEDEGFLQHGNQDWRRTLAGAVQQPLQPGPHGSPRLGSSRAAPVAAVRGRGDGPGAASVSASAPTTAPGRSVGSSPQRGMSPRVGTNGVATNDSPRETTAGASPSMGSTAIMDRAGHANGNAEASVSRPPRRESLSINTNDLTLATPTRLAPSRAPNEAAASMPPSDAVTSFYDPALPASNPTSPLTPVSPVKSPAARYSPLAAFLGSSPTPSQHSSSSNLIGGASPILSASLFGEANVRANGAGSPDTTTSSLRPNSLEKPLPALSAPGMVGGVETTSRKMQELSLHSSESLTRLSTRSRESSPSATGRHGDHSSRTPSKLVESSDEVVRRSLIDSISGLQRGSRHGSSAEPSPTRRPAPATPTTPTIVPPLQARGSTKAVTETLPLVNYFDSTSRPAPPDSSKAKALAGARERNTSASGERSPKQAAPAPPMFKSGPSRFEEALYSHPTAVLRGILACTSYGDFCSLRSSSRSLRQLMDEGAAKELVLQRFLGPWGYKSYDAATNPTSGAAPEPIILTLRDLDAFLISTEISIDQYARFAKDYNVDRLHPNTLRVIRASTRAWNRVVLRLRWQLDSPVSIHKRAWLPYAFEGQVVVQGIASVFRPGRAPTLRTWVPVSGQTSWMTDGEVVECEREVWRSGVWNELRRGDVVANTAVAPFGNLGKLIFDGKFLRDFEYHFDVVGHLPSWLGMLSFSPQYYHNIVASSTSSPVFYLCLKPYFSQAQQSLALREDKVQFASPQGAYIVKRFMFRGEIKLRAKDVVGGPSSYDIVHPDWVGTIMLELEGTTEHLHLALGKIASEQPTPWRILRDKSRPGKLWIRPVLDDEAV